MKSLHQRFMEKVSPEAITGCWLWTNTPNKDGYGIFNFNGTKALAHRASWSQHKGEIPAGMQVLHRCDTPACVAPHHLFIGTQRDNIQDMHTKGRGHKRNGNVNKTHCKNGHPLSGENLTIRFNGDRLCKACNAARSKSIRQLSKETK